MWKPRQIGSKTLPFEMIEEKKILKIEDMSGNEVYLGWESVSEVWSLESVLRYRLSYSSGSNFKYFYEDVIRAVAEMSGDVKINIYNIINRPSEKSDDVCCMLEVLLFMPEKALFDVQLERRIQEQGQKRVKDSRGTILLKKMWMLYAQEHWTKSYDLKSAVERLYEELGALEFDADHEAIYGMERYYTVQQCEGLRDKYKIGRKDIIIKNLKDLIISLKEQINLFQTNAPGRCDEKTATQKRLTKSDQTTSSKQKQLYSEMVQPQQSRPIRNNFEHTDAPEVHQNNSSTTNNQSNKQVKIMTNTSHQSYDSYPPVAITNRDIDEKTKENNTTLGTNTEDCDLTAVNSRRNIFVARLHSETTVAQLTNHVTKHNIKILEIKKLEIESHSISAFKVTILSNKVIYKPEIWPKYTTIRPFQLRRNFPRINLVNDSFLINPLHSNFNVICITEHWMTIDDVHCLKINNWIVGASFSRTIGIHGGVLILIKHSSSIKTLNNINICLIEFNCEVTAILDLEFNVVIINFAINNCKFN
ncbi:hypothetical protein FQA39_LY16533 [Lamprigera yunnana]|nr:hypothetical protein FQA39_LY16533 [Lamprigera yunnana]